MGSNDVQQCLRRVPAHLLAAQTEEAGDEGGSGGWQRLAE